MTPFYADHGRAPTRLKSRLPLWPTYLVLLTMTGSIAGCSLFTSKNVQTALDIAKVLCIVANAESDDQTVKTVCGIVDAEDAAFHAVLGEQRKAARRYSSSRCDAVTPRCDAGLCPETGK